jgi:hypothetical protein
MADRTYEPFSVDRLPSHRNTELDMWGKNKHGEFSLQTGEFIPWSDDNKHDDMGYCEDHMMWPSQASGKLDKSKGHKS